MGVLSFCGKFVTMKLSDQARGTFRLGGKDAYEKTGYYVFVYVYAVSDWV